MQAKNCMMFQKCCLKKTCHVIGHINNLISKWSQTVLLFKSSVQSVRCNNILYSKYGEEFCSLKDGLSGISTPPLQIACSLFTSRLVYYFPFAFQRSAKPPGTQTNSVRFSSCWHIVRPLFMASMFSKSGGEGGPPYFF